MSPSSYLIYLDIVAGTVHAINPDGSNPRVLVADAGHQPDGIQVDYEGFRMYWTAMGHPKENDGKVYAANLDGTDVGVIVEGGKTHTPKQLFLDRNRKALYWCDREGGRIQSCDTDGGALTTVYDSAPGKPRPLSDPKDWCVGIVLDIPRKHLYWTQKGPSKGGQGRIFRMRLEVDEPVMECLYRDLPEPIDLELNRKNMTLYWTDRGEVPYGNTLNQAVVSAEVSPDRQPTQITPGSIIAGHFHEAIGLTADWEERKMYVADALGSIWVIDLDTREKKAIVRDVGNYTGITLVKGR